MKRETSRILYIDDDDDIISLLKYNLEKEGYEVKTISNPSNAVKQAQKYNPDLIILDVLMPGINGIEICRQLRSLSAFRNTIIFFLSARSENYIELAALETGGDDYIKKDTGLRALSFKIQIVLKDNMIIRKRDKQIRVGNMELHRESLSVSFGDKYHFLTKVEFELLYFLAQNPKVTISKKHLIHNIWGSETFMMSRSIDSHMKNIKYKLRRNLVEKVGDNGYRIYF